MILRTLTSLLMLFIALPMNGQTTLEWSNLENVDFMEDYDRERQEWSLKAEFSEQIQGLNGQEIIITGYIIPLDVSGNVYALSAFAFSSCFFCGGAGPETVMGLEFTADPPRMHTDDVVQLKGTLELHRTPGTEFHYMLTNVEIIKRY